VSRARSARARRRVCARATTVAVRRGRDGRAALAHPDERCGSRAIAARLADMVGSRSGSAVVVGPVCGVHPCTASSP
jgi:hypothetical protein